MGDGRMAEKKADHRGENGSLQTKRINVSSGRKKGKEGGTDLVELSIKHIPQMERSRQHDAVRDPPDTLVLERDHSEVDDDPENESRSHLVETLDVEVAETRVEGATDEPLRGEEGQLGIDGMVEKHTL
jgi:hypothetical protein